MTTEHRPLSERRTRLALLAALVPLALALAMPPALEAQVPVQEGPLPLEVERHAIELANAPGTLRLPGRALVPEGSVVTGDVVVLGGGLRLGGRIAGELVVANGDLVLAPGAVVEGAVLLLGGRLVLEEGATAPADIRIHAAPLRYRIRGDRVVGIGEGGVVPSRFLESDLGFGRTRFTLRADGAYNRVEGLPVAFGPVVETGGRNPLVLSAFGIWRSISGLSLDTDRMGYDVSLSQGIGGRGTASLALGAFRRMRPIEERGMSDLESSLSTFFMRRDYRDHYDAEGWDATLTLRPITVPLRVELAFAEEEHGFAPIEGPWSLGDGERPWRLQPRVGEGRGTFFTGRVEWDSRDDPRHPADGWWVRLEATRQLGGALSLPPSDFGPEVAFERVSRGVVDLRRYARITPASSLRARYFMSGSLRGHPLPPQFQSALGGEGSLPGHRRFDVDCGAREGPLSFTLSSGENEAFTGYGCDRVRLAQLELVHALPLVWDPFPDGFGDPELAGLTRIQPSVSVFFNTGDGKAHTLEAIPNRRNERRHSDLGVGLGAGPLGLYWSYPLSESERGLNFFVRLDYRF